MTTIVIIRSMSTERGTWNYLRARERIVELGRTRQWVAGQLGLSPATLRTLLSGQKPGRQTLKLMARVLELNESDLAGNEEAAS